MALLSGPHIAIVEENQAACRSPGNAQPDKRSPDDVDPPLTAPVERVVTDHDLAEPERHAGVAQAVSGPPERPGNAAGRWRAGLCRGNAHRTAPCLRMQLTSGDPSWTGGYRPAPPGTPSFQSTNCPR